MAAPAGDPTAPRPARGRGAFALLLLAAAAVAPAAAGADPPVLSIADARLAEGDSGGRTLRFALVLSAPLEAPLELRYTTEDGTARADSDYVAAKGLLRLEAADTGGAIEVTILGDTAIEGNEVFRVRLDEVTGAILGDSVAIGTILNDERTWFAPTPENTFTRFPGTLPIAFGDFDRDGDEDLPLHEHLGLVGFAERSEMRALLGGENFHGGAWCDYDRDGDPDLVLLPYSLGASDSSRCRLFRNDDGVLVDVAGALGINLYGHGETVVWGDFNGDRWPDFFAPYYSYVPPFRSFLYLNNADGTFREDAVAAGVALLAQPEALKPEGAHAVDWNGDGFLDLYCASHLWLNDGTGVFTDVREDVGLPAVFDEGCEFVDFDSDGDFDLSLRTASGPRLFRNDAGQFVEVTAAAGLPGAGLAWGDRWADVDNDGDPDLLLVTFPVGVQLLVNRGDGSFEADSAFAGLGIRGTYMALADLDLDGDLDFVIEGDRLRLYLNRLDTVPGAARSYLRLEVLGESGRRTAFGATARLRHLGVPEAGTQARAVDGGSAYLTQSEYTLTFGGVGDGPWSLEVRYPTVPFESGVLDGHAVPLLGDLEFADLRSRNLRVYRDGRIESAEPGVVGAPTGGVRARRGRGVAFTGIAPQPARAATSFGFDVRRAGRVDLELRDVTGRAVRSLALGPHATGAGRASWALDDRHGQRVRAGVYFARLLLDGQPEDTRRLVVLP